MSTVCRRWSEKVVPVTFLLVFLMLDSTIVCQAEKMGWPVKIDDEVYSSPLLVDINNDGKLEVIVGSAGTKKTGNGSVYVWGYDATLLDGWPQKVTGLIEGTPAVGNFEAASKELEIAVGTTAGQICIWHQDGTLVKNWPVTLPGGIFSSLTAADLDNDGQLDLIASCSEGKVYAYRISGSPLAGWPKDAGAICAAPVVKDLNGDGKMEVLVVNNKGKSLMWTALGEVMPGWSAEGVGFFPPVTGDLDQKSKGLEIVLAGPDNIRIMHTDGTPLPGWPKEVISPGPPAIGDIDGDGAPEIVVVSNNVKDASPLVYAWETNGTLAGGKWPADLGTLKGYAAGSTPVLVDLDGDGKLEIIIASYCYSICVLRSDGSTVGPFPITRTAGIGMQYYSPAVADLDKNGRMEMVFGDTSDSLKVHVFEMSFSYR